jgi:hypothetical protein
MSQILASPRFESKFAQKSNKKWDRKLLRRSTRKTRQAMDHKLCRETRQRMDQEIRQDIFQEIRQEICGESCDANWLQIRHSSAEKSAILQQERKWRNTINEQLLKLSLSLEILLQTKTIKIMKPHSITYKTESTIVEASGVAPTPATRHSLISKPN